MIIIFVILVLMFAVIIGLISSIFPGLFFKAVDFDKAPTNIDALIGQKAVVISDIWPYNNGYVKVGGEVWLAKSKDDQTIQAGHIVEVVSVSGCHVVVKAKT